MAWESRVDEPIMPLGLFRRSIFRVSVILSFLVGIHRVFLLVILILVAGFFVARRLEEIPLTETVAVPGEPGTDTPTFAEAL